MTYFHRRLPTIIGAGAFHRPVRDGKGWFHSAMVVRQRGGERGCPQSRIRIVWLAVRSRCRFDAAACLEEGVGLRRIGHTHCMLLKIIGSSLTGN